MFTNVHVNFQMDSLLEKASVKQLKPVPGIQRKLIPAWIVKRDPEPALKCQSDEFVMQQTPCLYGGSDDVMGCCPFQWGVCCQDHRTCCVSPMECVTTADGKAMCATNSSVTVRLTG